MKGKLISRRTALRIGGAFALTAARQSSAAGQGARQAGRIIDVHHHYFAPVFVAKRREQILESGGTNVIGWMPQISLDQMDAAGVTTAILSSAGPGVVRQRQPGKQSCNGPRGERIRSSSRQ
jgi:6-methylsalicylate decarboxylase